MLKSTRGSSAHCWTASESSRSPSSSTGPRVSRGCTNRTDRRRIPCRYRRAAFACDARPSPRARRRRSGSGPAPLSETL